jgi:UTP--glucose-1-phosphate uridylyltransferase
MAIDLAVVTVAAQGIRMLPLTKSQPREMLPVGRKPAVQYVVDELNQAGCRRLLFITGPEKASIENHFSVNENLVALLRETCREDYLAELDFERQDLDYFFTRQRRQLGLGHAVLCAKPLVDEANFVVALGDSIIGVGGNSDIVPRLVEEFESTGADAVIAIEPIPAESVEQSGIVVAVNRQNHSFRIGDIVEKPTADDAPSNLAVAGRYVFSPKIFPHLEKTTPGKDGQIQLTDGIKSLIAGGGHVRGVLLREGEHRFDIGDFESYFRTFLEFALADPKYGPALARHLETLVGKQGS